MHSLKPTVEIRQHPRTRQNKAGPRHQTAVHVLFLKKSMRSQEYIYKSALERRKGENTRTLLQLHVFGQPQRRGLPALRQDITILNFQQL